MKGGVTSPGANFSFKWGRTAHVILYGLKEHLAMAPRTKFSEKFSLLSLTQQHNLPREKVSLLI
jgi:hypothetical protein